MRKAADIDRDIKEFVRKKMAEHRETFDEHNIRDFIDIYIKAEKGGEENGALTCKNEIIFHIDSITTFDSSNCLLIAYHLNARVHSQ